VRFLFCWTALTAAVYPKEAFESSRTWNPLGFPRPSRGFAKDESALEPLRLSSHSTVRK